VDLGELLIAELTGAHGSCLRWVGFEASEYAIAKTLVIAEMLLSEAPPMDIVQVWFSAAWTHRALKSFHLALAEVLSARCPASQEPHVQYILRHWTRQRNGVELPEARRLWLESRTRTASEIPSLKRDVDRAAMCAYVLAGDLVVDEPDVGSVVMFALPDGVGHISMDESVFEWIPIELLLQQQQESNGSIVGAAADLLRQLVLDLSEAVSSGTVTIEVRLRCISPDDARDTLQSIGRDLRPASMSWSNLCDYYAPADFHKMAQTCSSKCTRHYVSPMNWPREVCGAFILDYDDVDAREALRAECESKMKRQYKEIRLDQVLFVPPMGNPMNRVDAYLCGKLFPMWSTRFLQESPTPVRLCSSSQPIYTELLRTSTSMAISYEYK